MPNQQLLDYVNFKSKQGISNEEIKKLLLEAGWKDEDINNGFDYINKSNINNTSVQVDGEVDTSDRNKSDSKEKTKGFILIIIIGFFLSFLFGPTLLGLPEKILLSKLGKSPEDLTYADVKKEKEMFPMKATWGEMKPDGTYTVLNQQELQEIEDYNNKQMGNIMARRNQQAKIPSNIFWNIISFFSAQITVIIIAILYFIFYRKDKIIISKNEDNVKTTLVDKIISFIYIIVLLILLLVIIASVVFLFKTSMKHSSGLEALLPLYVIVFSLPLLVIFTILGIRGSRKKISDLKINNILVPFYIRFLYFLSKSSLIFTGLLIVITVLGSLVIRSVISLHSF